MITVSFAAVFQVYLEVRGDDEAKVISGEERNEVEICWRDIQNDGF